MQNRREFVSTIGLAGLAAAQPPATKGETASPVSDGREFWVKMLTRVAEPVLANLAANRLKALMPMEAAPGSKHSRRDFAHLEALGRTLAGVAPWLVCPSVPAGEEPARARFAALSRQALANITNPAAADHIDFVAGPQDLVDAAFLAEGLARGRAELWTKLDASVQQRLVAALQSTRKFKPGQNNWLLFAAMVEAFLASVGAEWLPEPIETAVRAHEEWYKGDGVYGDGPSFHWDYYNSYVIQPMFVEVLELVAPVTNRWAGLQAKVLQRARRYAAVQERLIAPDGSFPPLGRSIVYRCGAFHHLAMMAWRRQLPEGVAPAQVRGALAAVIQRTLGAPGTFDDNGWLRMGLAGHQPSLAETYISTGSLYLCTCVFLPLGLGAKDEFWAAPAADWTSRKIWRGTDLPRDHAL